MPESHGRKEAAAKKQFKNQQRLADQREEAARQAARSVPGAANRWVVPSFITVGLLGVAWLITFYIAGDKIPAMARIGNWNVLIGMAMIVASFVIASFWK